MSREEMEEMRQFRCVCGKVFHNLEEFLAHCGFSDGVHEEAGPDEDAADAPQASPDAPGDTQAPVPDPMPEPAPAEAQSADKRARQYGTVSLPTPGSTFTARLMYAPDYRMEIIATLAELASLQMDSNDQQDAYATIQRIHELAGDR